MSRSLCASTALAIARQESATAHAASAPPTRSGTDDVLDAAGGEGIAPSVDSGGGGGGGAWIEIEADQSAGVEWASDGLGWIAFERTW